MEQRRFLMAKSVMHFIFIVAGVMAVLGLGGNLQAQPPDISIDLRLDNDFFVYGEPIGVEVEVCNNSGGDILISKGFTSMAYYLEMRVIDPSNQLLLAEYDGFKDELPDAPPLGWQLYDGHPIQVADCEVFHAGCQPVSRTDDLREYYALELPGYYSAQVQLSAMVFKGASGDPCDVNDYEWLGVLKSETQYFYVEGSTEVKIVPEKWRIVWQNGKYLLPNLEVVIWPEDGKTIDDYQQEGIRLNNVEAEKVWKLYSFIKKKHYLLAFFNKKEAVKSLGDVTVGQSYPARISGRLTSGKYFGGSRQIKIVR
jgi:hypothetical protein